MAVSRFRGALLAWLPALAFAQVSAPGTPAGQALDAWLDAINSDDRARQESFVKANPAFVTIDDLVNWRAGVGGYELLEIYRSEPTNIFFRVKQKSWPVEEAGRLQVSAGKPASILTLGIWRVPPGAKFQPLTLDDAARARVVGRLSESLQAFHVDAATGRRLGASVRKRSSRGEYRGLRYIDAFARKLTEDLRAAGHDRHLEVRSNYFTQPAQAPKVDEEEKRRLAVDNCGFEKAEHLRPNVGYLKFDFFADPESCAATANAAMTFLADSDALILDLRDNNGGRGAMLVLLASYLFAQSTHLSDDYRRWDDSTRETWTLPSVPGRRFLDKPVYVLISSRTFSAGEALAFVLQDQRRALLIGEATVGGSGAIEFKPIDEHFTLILPTTRVISPVTKKDWAGTGVQPDVKVPADQALEAALKMAAK